MTDFTEHNCKVIEILPDIIDMRKYVATAMQHYGTIEYELAYYDNGKIDILRTKIHANGEEYCANGLFKIGITCDINRFFDIDQGCVNKRIQMFEYLSQDVDLNAITYHDMPIIEWNIKNCVDSTNPLLCLQYVVDEQYIVDEQCVVDESIELNDTYYIRWFRARMRLILYLIECGCHVNDSMFITRNHPEGNEQLQKFIMDYYNNFPEHNYILK